MIFERDGRRFEYLVASNLQRDTMTLELWELLGEDRKMVLLGETTDAGPLRFLGMGSGEGNLDSDFLPLDLVEEFLRVMKERLPLPPTEPEQPPATNPAP